MEQGKHVTNSGGYPAILAHPRRDTAEIYPEAPGKRPHPVLFQPSILAFVRPVVVALPIILTISLAYLS